MFLQKDIRVQSIKFNIRTATVGGINQNGVVTFGKICHLPRAETAVICTVIKRATGAREGRPQYPYLETQLHCGTGKVGVSQRKSCR